MEEVSISDLLTLSTLQTKGFSSSWFKVDPGIKGEVTLSADHPQLLALRDSTGSIPCICPEFSINILGNVINATRWHLTSVDDAARSNLPPFYLEIAEFDLREMAVTPVLGDETRGNIQSIVSDPDSNISVLSGRLLHVYPIFTVHTYLLLFQIQEERVYVFFSGNDLLSLHSLLKSNQEYEVTNLSERGVVGVESKVRIFHSTQETNVMPVISETTSDSTPTIHDDHSTVEGVVTKFVDLASGHFILDNSMHLFLCHMPSVLPVWGMKVGAKIRVSGVRMCSIGSNVNLTRYAWCCHHTRIEVLSTSERPQKFYPYLPQMLLFAQLTPLSALHLTVILEKFKKTCEISHSVLHSLIELFNLNFLDPPYLMTDLMRLMFTKECIAVPFTELSLSTTHTLTDLTELLSLSFSQEDFVQELNTTRFDFTSHPSWDRMRHSSTLVEGMMKGFLIGKVSLCPDTGHVIISDKENNIPIHFSTGIFPDELVNIVDSIVAVKHYDIIVERSAFPNQIVPLSQTYLCTRYKDLHILLPGSNKPVKTGSYLLLVMAKSPMKLDAPLNKRIELKFCIYAKVYLNCITSYSQCVDDPSHTLIGELPLMFTSDMVKWWSMLEAGWLYYWGGYDSSQINTYIISRGNRMPFKPEWSLHPVGQLPTRPMLAPDNDIISLLHKVNEGECKTCLIIGQVNAAAYISNQYLKGNFVCKNEDWMVEMRSLKPISISELQKYKFPLFPFFYSLKLNITFPITDFLFLPIYINLPLSRLPLGLEVGAWVRLTAVKIKYQNSMLKGNIDGKGSIEVLHHHPSNELPSSIYSKIKPLSPANFRTFQALSIRVAKSLTQEETIEHAPQNISPAKGMYSNRFAFCKEQRVTELERRRMQKFSILLRSQKILRLTLRLDKIISLTIQKSCYCCKLQTGAFSSCSKSSFKLTANLFAYVCNETVIVKTTNLCTRRLAKIDEAQMTELTNLLENGHLLEIDKSYFESNLAHSPPPQWLSDLFSNFRTSKLDAIVTHYILSEHLNTPGKYPFQLTLYNFKVI